MRKIDHKKYLSKLRERFLHPYFEVDDEEFVRRYGRFVDNAPLLDRGRN